MENRRKMLDYLWPIGGTVFGILVVPLAIAQYPEFFNENTWVLPISVGVVVFCWCVPLLLHQRALSIYRALAAKGSKGWAVLVIGSLAALLICYMGFTRLLQMHKKHLVAIAARAITHEISPSATVNVPTVPPKSGNPGDTRSEQLLSQLQQTLKQEEMERSQPIIKRDLFNTLIPIAVTDTDAGIPIDSNFNDPKSQVYSELRSIAYIPLEHFDSATHAIVFDPVTDAVIKAYIGHTLQYYMVRSIDLMTHPMQSVNYEQGKGTTLNPMYLISVPEATDYSEKNVDALLRTLGTKMIYSINSGKNDWVWRNLKYQIPRGTTISTNEDGDSYELRYERKDDYYVKFIVSFTGKNQGVGTFPANFQPDFIGHLSAAYCYFILVKMEFNWYGKDHSKVNDYQDWAMAMFEGLKRELAVS